MDDTHIICKEGHVSYYVFHEDGTSERYVVGSYLTGMRVESVLMVKTLGGRP